MADLHDWRDNAACRNHPNPDVFEESGAGTIAIEGLRICRGCPVRTKCLDFVLAWPAADDTGLVWGGTTHKARIDIRRGLRTRDEAMADGYRQAERRTPDEVLAAQEPWLLEDAS